jgi:hypothetical protein
VLGVAAAAGALSGCSWLGSDPPEPPPPDPLEPLLSATRALRARYAAVLAAHPDLTGRLRPLDDAHAAHESALVDLIGRPELASPSTGTGSWAPPAGEVADPDQALAMLRDAERDGQAEAAQACLSAPPERAALLGSITAARATHAEVLR